MPDQTLVHDKVVREVVELGESLQPLRVKLVSYRVGPHGPFTLRYPVAEFTPERVNADIEKEVAALRAIGALPAG